MKLNDNTRAAVNVTAIASVDLATATLVLAIDEVEYPCTWDAAATTTGTRWTRQAHTTGYFAGPALPIGLVNGATVLSLGIHQTELRCTIGTTIVATTVEPITVRAG